MNSFRKFSSLLVISLFTIAMVTSLSMQNNAYAEQGFAVNVSALEGSGKSMWRVILVVELVTLLH